MSFKTDATGGITTRSPEAFQRGTSSATQLASRREEGWGLLPAESRAGSTKYVQQPGHRWRACRFVALVLGGLKWGVLTNSPGSRRSFMRRSAIRVTGAMMLALVLAHPGLANLAGHPFDAGDGNLVFNDEAQDRANAPNLEVGLGKPTGQQDDSFGQGTKPTSPRARC